MVAAYRRGNLCTSATGVSKGRRSLVKIFKRGVVGRTVTISALACYSIWRWKIPPSILNMILKLIKYHSAINDKRLAGHII